MRARKIKTNKVFVLVIVTDVCPLAGILAAIKRNSLAIYVKFGLCSGSIAQHLSISDLHSGSQFTGTGGLKVLLTIPSIYMLQNKMESIYLHYPQNPKPFPDITFHNGKESMT